MITRPPHTRVPACCTGPWLTCNFPVRVHCAHCCSRRWRARTRGQHPARRGRRGGAGGSRTRPHRRPQHGRGLSAGPRRLHPESIDRMLWHPPLAQAGTGTWNGAAPRGYRGSDPVHCTTERAQPAAVAPVREPQHAMLANGTRIPMIGEGARCRRCPARRVAVVMQAATQHAGDS